MATDSDQIQAEIAATRARMAARLDEVGADSTADRSSVSTGYARASGESTSVADQIRRRPLAALGVSLIAGSLVRDYLSGEGGTAPAATGMSGSGASQVRTTASRAVGTVGDAAQTVGHTVSDVAQGTVDTVRDAASTVADTTVDVAQLVASTAGDAAAEVVDTTGDLVGTLNEQIRRQPLVALGLSVAAGALLKNYLSGSQSSSTYPGATGQGYRGYEASGTYGAYGRGASTARASTRDASGGVGDLAQSAGTTMRDAAGSVAHSVSDTAQGAVETVRDAASTVADTTADVAHRVADTTGDVVDRVVETAGDAAEQVSETWTGLTWQVQERPLTVLGLAIAAGMVLQPTLAPYVSRVTSGAGEGVRSVTGGIGELASVPEPSELDRIKQALVPATVDRSRQLVSHDLRDYLERSLEGVLGQTTMRAGVVAAIVEKAEAFVENRLPSALNSLSDSSTLLSVGLAGAILNARSEVQQREAPTAGSIKAEIVRTIVQRSQEQLSRHFPEFRERYEAVESSTQRCRNCGTETSPGSRFCPSCGTPTSA